ncbi:MAG: hypothetical protein ACI4AM_01215 [Muribaculaceae bacterium]
MEHNFENLASVLNRCSSAVADQVIAEIRIAINEANKGSQSPGCQLTKMAMRVRKTRAERAEARRAKAAERRAAKKAAKEAAKQAEAQAQPVSAQPIDSAERSESPRCSSVARRQPSGAEAPYARHFSEKMVKYLRQCPAPQMLSVLNSYTHFLLTGSLIHTDSDHRYVDNFIYLARLEGLIVTEQEPTVEEASTFLFDNPASPLPRAERRRLQRLARKHKL